MSTQDLANDALFVQDTSCSAVVSTGGVYRVSGIYRGPDRIAYVKVKSDYLRFYRGGSCSVSKHRVTSINDPASHIFYDKVGRATFKD